MSTENDWVDYFYRTEQDHPDHDPRYDIEGHDYFDDDLDMLFAEDYRILEKKCLM